MKIDKKVFVIVGLCCLVVLAFILFKLRDDDNNSNISDKDRIAIVDSNNISFEENSVNMISNQNCNSSSKKYNYSLSLENGKLLVNSYDTYENFYMNKIKNIKTINSINYTSNCENSIYVLLTEDGKLYFTDDDIVKIRNIRKIDQEFRLLDTDYIISNIVVNNNKLFAVVSTGEMVEIRVN